MTRHEVYQLSILKTRWHKYANQLIEVDRLWRDRVACTCVDCHRTLERGLDYHAHGRRKQKVPHGF